MNRFFTLLLAASCLTAVGQVTYPYNPDGNADGDIAVGDLQDFLVTYGNPFSPSEIMVGDSSLTYWVEQLSQTVQEQQEVIELLKGGDSRSLRFPCGLNGALPHHQSLNSTALNVPQDSLFFLTNVTTNESVPIGFEDELMRLLSFSTANGDRSTFLTGSSPMILGEGMSFGPAENCNVSGFWIKSGAVEGFARVMSDPFVVPADKWLVLTHYQAATGTSVLEADGIPIVEENYYSQLQQFPTPIILGSATELNSYLTCLTCQDQLYYVHGYLVDKDYFDTPLQESEQETTLTIDWSGSNTDTLILSGEYDELQVLLPTATDQFWEIQGWQEGEYFDGTVPAAEVINLVLGFESISSIEPAERVMQIDIAGLSSKEIHVSFDRIDDNASALSFLESVDAVWPDLGMVVTNPCWTSQYQPFRLVVYDGNVRLTSMSSSHMASWWGFGLGCPDNTTPPQLEGIGVKHFRRLLSGSWSQVN